MIAVDMSNYTDPLTADALQQLIAAGVGHVIVQAVDPPPGYPVGRTRDQIQACIDTGLSVDAYIWLWFDLDTADIQRKLGLLDGLNIHQLWLDVEDTSAVKYDQATTETKVAAALAACDAYATLSGARTGVYSGRWFWLDRRYMGNTSTFADRELWDANYDDIADAALGFAPYGGWTQCVIKQYRGTSVIGAVGGLDVNVLSVDKAATLAAPTEPAPTPDPGPPTNPDQPSRQTPPDWPWPTWYEAAVQYKGIADALGQQLAALQPTPAPPPPPPRETPNDWQWPTWFEAAVQYKAIADALGKQVAAVQQAAPPPSA